MLIKTEITAEQRREIFKSLCKLGPEAICSAFGIWDRTQKQRDQLMDIAYRYHKDPEKFCVAISAWESTLNRTGT